MADRDTSVKNLYDIISECTLFIEKILQNGNIFDSSSEMSKFLFSFSKYIRGSINTSEIIDRVNSRGLVSLLLSSKSVTKIRKFFLTYHIVGNFCISGVHGKHCSKIKLSQKGSFLR